MNHTPISMGRPLAQQRAKSQAFCQISPEPCDSDYLDSAKNNAFLQASALFTGDELGAEGAAFKIRLGKSSRAMMAEADSCRLVEALIAAIDGTRCVDEIFAETSSIASECETLIVLEELLETGQIELGAQRTA